MRLRWLGWVGRRGGHWTWQCQTGRARQITRGIGQRKTVRGLLLWLLLLCLWLLLLLLVRLLRADMHGAAKCDLTGQERKGRHVRNGVRECVRC